LEKHHHDSKKVTDKTAKKLAKKEAKKAKKLAKKQGQNLAPVQEGAKDTELSKAQEGLEEIPDGATEETAG